METILHQEASHPHCYRRQKQQQRQKGRESKQAAHESVLISQRHQLLMLPDLIRQPDIDRERNTEGLNLRTLRTD
jgi:hypothetical protein